ncbi:MAG: SpoIIIAH-like family protein [Defluviitaleaceae bacterium]|nr:SpoIIIAH-like family protein [Defluviitaleaceae bacterium]
MFVLKRNQVIITALVIMIAVAGYLSWNDARTQAETASGYILTDQGEIAALISDNGNADAFFADDYDGLISTAWLTTPDDPTIAVSGDDYEWFTLSGLDLNEFVALPTNEDTLTEAGEAIFVNQSRDSLFVQNRLNREQSHSSERAVLNDLINNNNVEVEQRAKAADAMLEIQRRIERETAAEALIESKGFSEAYVRISDNGVDVIVSKDSLTDGELAQIMDIIKRKTGMNETQIHISPMRR